MICMYNTNEDILVVKKSDHQNNAIGDRYFIVPKKEWLSEDDSIRTFHLFLTKIESDRISLYLAQGKYPVIFRDCRLISSIDYISQ